MTTTELHPWQPFLPERARVLMLGSFPPVKRNWAMEFYYPNRNNDFWRIVGLIFFDNSNRFLTPKGFDEAAILAFLTERGIAMYDAAVEVHRPTGNSSDKDLEIVRELDLGAILAQIPDCRAISVTGELAGRTLLTIVGGTLPAVGESVAVKFAERELLLFRMPSTSRAYPAPLDRKAAVYAQMFHEVGILK